MTWRPHVPSGGGDPMPLTTSEPRETVRCVSAILVLDTSRRHESPRLERAFGETAEAFADRVRDLLLKMQRDIRW